MPVLKLEPPLAPHVTKVQKAEGRAFESRLRLGTRFPELEPGFLLTPAKPPCSDSDLFDINVHRSAAGCLATSASGTYYPHLRSAASASPRSTAHYRHRPWPLSGPSHAVSGQVRYEDPVYLGEYLARGPAAAAAGLDMQINYKSRYSVLLSSSRTMRATFNL